MLIEKLKAVRALLTPEKAWIKGDGARDANNWPTNPSNPKAVKWCLLGAIDKCSSTLNWKDDYQELCGAVEPYLDHSSIIVYNDAPERTHEDILALLDKAIRHQEAADINTII